MRLMSEQGCDGRSVCTEIGGRTGEAGVNSRPASTSARYCRHSAATVNALRPAILSAIGSAPPATAKDAPSLLPRRLRHPWRSVLPDGVGALPAGSCPIHDDVGDDRACLPTCSQPAHRAIPDGLTCLKRTDVPKTDLGLRQSVHRSSQVPDGDDHGPIGATRSDHRLRRLPLEKPSIINLIMRQSGHLST